MRKKTSWLPFLKDTARDNRIVVLRLGDYRRMLLEFSPRGVNEFTIALPKDSLRGAKGIPLCLISMGTGKGENLYLGLISSRNNVSTFDMRIKIKRATEIRPRSTAGLLRLVTEQPHAGNLRRRLLSPGSVEVLSPKLGAHLVEKLASIDGNRDAMRIVAESLSAPGEFQGPAALQESAVRGALKAFGLYSGDQASSVRLVEGRQTTLSGMRGVTEDSVIEHDARSVPGYDLFGSDLTGRAVFQRGNERLEVFTANRRPLERVFGVDLIYLNLTRHNVVMVQYKMLEPSWTGAAGVDWIYRLDSDLDEQIRRMRKFTTTHHPAGREYRFNPAVFYLKFVRRDSSINKGGFILPVEHFEKLRNDPTCRGPNNGLRVSWESLDGRYLREAAFFDLIRSGYIGAYAETTTDMKTLIDWVLERGKSAVAAIQKFMEPVSPRNTLLNESTAATIQKFMEPL